MIIADPLLLWNSAFKNPALAQRLHDPELLQRWGSFGSRMFNVPGAPGVAAMAGRVRCAAVAEGLSPLLSGVEAPEGGFLSYCEKLIECSIFKRALPGTEEQQDAGWCILTALQVVLDLERRSAPYDPMMDFDFLMDSEQEGETGAEYRRFLTAWREDHIYELLRISAEVTPYRTLSHIAGVHHMALYCARSLKRAGVMVDLCTAGAAAAGHDIGKFGCLPGERVPYLHYYYTDRWFHERGLDCFGSIAANHSVWDLEPEALSVESMLLIYADFRVKQERGADGEEITKIFTLDESFRVILDKLDNVDDAKRRRYSYVYRKLKDFEDYMIGLGVDVTLKADLTRPAGKRPPTLKEQYISLMTPEEAEQKLRMLAVQHNLSIMGRLSHEQLFAELLESARSEKDRSRLRTYINVFDEYCTYLTAAQKDQTLAFLYDLLLHRDGEIRRQAAALIGKLLAKYSLRYKKQQGRGDVDRLDARHMDVLRETLSKILYPDRHLTDRQISHIHFTWKLALAALFENCSREDGKAFFGIVSALYEENDGSEPDAVLALLEGLSSISREFCSSAQEQSLFEFGLRYVTDEQPTLQAAALRFFCGHIPEGTETKARLLAALRSSKGTALLLQRRYAPLRSLRSRLIDRLQGKGASRDLAAEFASVAEEDVSDLFIDNLGTTTPWVLKVINVEYLRDYLKTGRKDRVMQIAAHFANLVKVSETVVVRYAAAEALVEIAPLLTFDRRNEIAVELCKGLEVGESEFSKYIPRCLGEFALFLRPSELDDLLVRMQGLLCHANSSVSASALTTVGFMLEHYGCYPARYPGTGTHDRRKRSMAGLLLKGMASDRPAVQQEAVRVFGDILFGSAVMSDEEKNWLFDKTVHKIPVLIREYPDTTLNFLYVASALYHIYRYQVAHFVDAGPFTFRSRTKVAFFPGTFDPFTLGHKEIARTIRDRGFEVYLAVDEFSWSKKTLPSLIRRQIVSMSVADEFHIHLFPCEIPVNLAIPSDLRALKELFPGKELYLAVGSDVITGASSYRKEPEPDSVHSMNHIIFRRESQENDGSYGDRSSRITGDVLELRLPTQLEDVSSGKIRENVDLGRDISSLIDPQVQEFIWKRGLYLREPQYKPLIRTEELRFEELRFPSYTRLLATAEACGLERAAAEKVCSGILSRSERVVTLTEGSDPGRILGFASMLDLRGTDLYGILLDEQQTDALRDRAFGKLLCLTGIHAVSEDSLELLLTEVLTEALGRDCTCAFFAEMDCPAKQELLTVLQCCGFSPRGLPQQARRLLFVNMHAPVVLMQNAETTVKAPFNNDERVLRAIREARRALKRSLVDLYPGKLILSFSTALIHHRLVEKITALNGVPSAPVYPRRLGHRMCVPFGKLLRGHAVPNTVTKTIHTDKVYERDLSSYSVEPFPGYAPLPVQVRTIRSFRRPVILVDDILDSGTRIHTVSPLAKAEGVEISEILVGILSGRGKDIADRMGHTVDYVYFIPNLTAWYLESTLYPFIGGDTVRCPDGSQTGLIPSVNMLLPYARPSVIDPGREDAFLRFSETCLNNALGIISTLETAYRELYARSLTLSRLGEAVVLPLCPDKGELTYDANLPVSRFLKSDLLALSRMKNK